VFGINTLSAEYVATIRIVFDSKVVHA